MSRLSSCVQSMRVQSQAARQPAFVSFLARRLPLGSIPAIGHTWVEEMAAVAVTEMVEAGRVEMAAARGCGQDNYGEG